MTTPDAPAEDVDVSDVEDPKTEQVLTLLHLCDGSSCLGVAAGRCPVLAALAWRQVHRAVLVDPLVDMAPPLVEPLDPGVPVLRDLLVRDPPPAHQQPLVHRQEVPDVGDGDARGRGRCARPAARRSPVPRPAPRAPHPDAGRARSSSPRPGSAIPCSPSLSSRLIARSRRSGVKLPPSGKITNASFSSRLRARSPTSVSRSGPRRDAG